MSKTQKKQCLVEPLELRRLLAVVTPLAVTSLADQSESPLVEDSAGDIFGTDSGITATNFTDGGGIFEIPVGSTTPVTLASFGAAGDGNTLGVEPNNLLIDSKGNLYGTTTGGGSTGAGGTLWKLPAGASSIKLLATFGDSDVGANPGLLTMDSAGNLFGYNPVGDDLYEYPADGSGLTLLGSVTNCTALAADSSGNLFGVDTNYTDQPSVSDIFEVPAGGQIQTITSFSGYNGLGAEGMVMDSNRDLLITTKSGGPFGTGALIELPAGSTTLKVLASLTVPFSPGFDSPPVLDAEGDLFAVADNQTVGLQVLELPAGGGEFQPVASLAPFANASITAGTAGQIIGLEQTDIHEGAGTWNVFDFVPSAVTGTPPVPTLFGTVNGKAKVIGKVELPSGGDAEFKLTGPGVGSVFLDSMGGIDLSVTSSTPATKIAITLAGKKTTAAIDDFYDYDSLGQLTAPGLSLDGSFVVQGSLSRVSLGSLNGATLSITGGPTTFTAGTVTASNITTEAALTLQVRSDISSNVSAGTMTSLNCLGTFSGGDLTAANMGAIVIHGNLTDSIFNGYYTTDYGTIATYGYTPNVIKSITVLGSMTDTVVRPAVFDPTRELGGGALLPLGGSKIGSVSVRGIVSDGTEFFAYHLPATAVIHGKRVKTAGDLLFVT